MVLEALFNTLLVLIGNMRVIYIWWFNKNLWKYGDKIIIFKYYIQAFTKLEPINA